jgi:outer membrane protein, protease secretion system
MAITQRPLFATSFICLASLTLALPSRALGLLEAYNAALANDPAYQAAVYDKDAGQQYTALGKAYLLPDISASYARYKNKSDSTTSTALGDISQERSYSSLSQSIQLRQPLFNPEGQARYRQGKTQTQASDAQFAARSQELIVRLVNLYANTKYAEDQLAQATAQREAYAEQRRANERLYILGEGTKTDVLETQAKYDLSDAQVLEARDALVNTRLALSAVVGREITHLDALSDNFKTLPMEPVNFETWQDTALANNPEILAQRLSVDIAYEEIIKNSAGHKPRLDLLINYSKSRSDTVSTFNQTTNQRSLGLQLNVPIYAGGAVTAATSQAMSRHQKAQADLDAKTHEVIGELRKQFNLASSAAPRIAAAEKALSSATLLVDATQKSVRGGQRTNVDVLNAQYQVFQAKRDLALTRYNYLLAYLRLRYSAGNLSAADLEGLAAYFVPSSSPQSSP